MKLVFHVPSSHSYLACPVKQDTAYIQLHPGINEITEEEWEEIKGLNTVRQHLQNGNLSVPNVQLILPSPPKNSTQITIKNASVLPEQNESKLTIPETKPVRVASKLVEKTVGEETNPKTKTSDSKAKTKFHGGVSSPSSE